MVAILILEVLLEPEQMGLLDVVEAVAVAVVAVNNLEQTTKVVAAVEVAVPVVVVLPEQEALVEVLLMASFYPIMASMASYKTVN